MNLLIYLVYPLLLVLLFYKSKVRTSEESDSFLDISQSKALLGFFALCIVFHHLSQETSASWLPETVRRSGLEFFVPRGFLYVSGFFFFSGFGLYKSYLTKENYLKNFLAKRIGPVLMVFVFTNIFVYYAMRIFFGQVTLPLNPYSWYIYAIIVFYLAFYLILRYAPKMFPILMPLAVLVYAVIAYELCLGNWWFNSTPAFLFGLWSAKNEQKLSKFVSKHLLPLFVTSFLMTTVFRSLGDSILSLNTLPFSVLTNLQIIFQMIASLSFTIFMMCVLKSFVFGNRFLSFLGKITLELYLIHGIFVQTFGYSFFDDTTPPLLYIENIVLYVCVVLVLSLPAAYLLYLGKEFLVKTIRKSEYTIIHKKGIKRFVMIIFGLLVCSLVFIFFYSKFSERKMVDSIEEYKAENISFTEISTGKIAYYSVGNSPEKLVIFGGDSNPCPTVFLRGIADYSDDSYSVYVIDRPGQGFSDDTKIERTVDNQVEEMKEIMDNLFPNDKVVLCFQNEYTLTALEYLNRYPEKVEYFVGLNPVAPSYYNSILKNSGVSVAEFDFRVRKQNALISLATNLVHFLGFDRLSTSQNDLIFNVENITGKYMDVLNEMSIKGSNTAAYRNASVNLYPNCSTLADSKLPEDVPGVLLMDFYSSQTDYGGVKWEEMTNSIISNPDIQEVVIMKGNPNMCYETPVTIANEIKIKTGKK